MDPMPDTETGRPLAVRLENVQLTLPSEAGNVHILQGIDLKFLKEKLWELSGRPVAASPYDDGNGRVGTGQPGDRRNRWC